jgi:hypothetical protein
MTTIQSFYNALGDKQHDESHRNIDGTNSKDLRESLSGARSPRFHRPSDEKATTAQGTVYHRYSVGTQGVELQLQYQKWSTPIDGTLLEDTRAPSARSLISEPADLRLYSYTMMHRLV